MCLGIPGKVIEVYEVEGTLMGKVDFDGVIQEVCLATTPEAQVDQFVLVHAGFALNVLSDLEASETLRILKDLEEFNRDYYGNQDAQ
ncbi:MAG: HypC/HybG/HupF family hydrogenase formation chaperone [Anaerolineaceae bacterium]|jgi:hydrogenase expression/formation protein HypC|nr:HypC/HybG/HupF family hydrogenase formation chaperone [Anaerolineaceae bacterium]MDD4042209.1 HypC/HybG/HupF family hydrogenase formation chaperone [Anaerolineaceae bacterium]MDD4577045.1 HypC/HybG/HupF family hydrogenase formation chaperone [Anaerolineaceae bacterium]